MHADGCTGLRRSIRGSIKREATAVNDRAKDEVLRQLIAVIAWELDAQRGIRRPLDEIPLHIADSLLDYFEIRTKPGVSFPE
jgi:hypothetical protein